VHIRTRYGEDTVKRILLALPIKVALESERLRTFPRGLRLSRNVGVRNAHFLDQPENMSKIAASSRLDTRQSIPRGQVTPQLNGSQGMPKNKVRKKASNTRDIAEFDGNFFDDPHCRMRFTQRSKQVHFLNCLRASETPDPLQSGGPSSQARAAQTSR
jgi:hypothetical protein